MHGFADGTEYDAALRKFFLKGGLHGHRVHHGIHRRTAQCQTFLQRDSEFIEGFHQLGVYLIQRFRPVLLHAFRRVGIVGNGLVIYLRHLQVRPRRLFLRLPITESLQTELKQPFRLFLFGRNETHHILVQATLYDFGLHVGTETVLIFLMRHLTDKLVFPFVRPLSVLRNVPTSLIFFFFIHFFHISHL